MSSLIPLVDLSSNLWQKVRKNWFRDNEMENSRGETDPLAERPETWYKGPLIFPAFPEEGVETGWGYDIEANRQEEYTHDSEGC